jgi:hypothetical protein
MNVTHSGTTVSIAQSQSEIIEALSFCGHWYERNYGTHWNTPPDLFFVAREDDAIVATGGLTFADNHAEIASERYYRLSPAMREFINTNRDRVVEFGRFASTKTVGAKAILYSILSHSAAVGRDFLFAWANPTIFKYTAKHFGFVLWPIPVALDLDRALTDPRWASPPVRFFDRPEPPALHMGVVPFWENIVSGLATECGFTQRPAVEGLTSNADIKIAAMMAKTSPRLLRQESPATNFSGNAGVPPFAKSARDEQVPRAKRSAK